MADLLEKHMPTTRPDIDATPTTLQWAMAANSSQPSPDPQFPLLVLPYTQPY